MLLASQPETQHAAIEAFVNLICLYEQGTTMATAEVI